MNKAILCGRLTANPEITYTQQDQMMIARYTLAIDRIGKNKGTDFIRCVAFDKRAQFAEKYLTKGMKIIVSGRIQTGSYKHKDGYTVYTTDILIDEQEFCESKAKAESNTQPEPVPSPAGDGFMEIPEGIDEELPWN